MGWIEKEFVDKRIVKLETYEPEDIPQNKKRMPVISDVSGMKHGVGLRDKTADSNSESVEDGININSSETQETQEELLPSIKIPPEFYDLNEPDYEYQAFHKLNQSQKEYDIREFDDTEITEINTYVTTQIPQSKLPQLFIITENPTQKAEIYIIIYRILEAARDFVEGPGTKEKLTKLLKQNQDVYDKCYKAHLLLSESGLINTHRQKNKVITLVEEHNHQITKLINSFLVFAEKQQLMSTEKVTGLDLMKEEGKDIYNKLITKV